MAYVSGREWHAEIGLPAENLSGKLSILRTNFPSARVFMFGYGKQSFFTAPEESLREYVLGPFPGPAVIQVVALDEPPNNAVTLLLPPDGTNALSAALWNDFIKSPSGIPGVVAPGRNRFTFFYAAESRYTIFHTCNTWIADALGAAGLPITSEGIVLVGQLMGRVLKIAENQCRKPI